MPKRESKFRSQVASNSHREKMGAGNQKYLNLPSGVDLFDPKIDVNLFDIIPYIVKDNHHPDQDKREGTAMPGEQWYKRPFFVHRIGPKREMVICLSSFGERCPICDYREKRKNAGAEKKEIKALYPSRRNLYAVISQEKGASDNIQIFDISQFCFQKGLNDELEVKRENVVFPDLEEGKTLEVRFNKETLEKNEFLKAVRYDFHDRDAYDEAILDEVPCLDELFEHPTYAELRDTFHMSIIDEDSEDEEEVEDIAPAKDMPTLSISRFKRRSEPKSEEEEEGTAKSPKCIFTGIRGQIPCVACGGTGLNSRGKECPICEGTGLKPKAREESAIERLPDKQESTPVRRTRPSSQPIQEKEENKCPYKYDFGVDVNKFKECDKCDVWESCMDAKEGVNK